MIENWGKITYQTKSEQLNLIAQPVRYEAAWKTKLISHMLDNKDMPSETKGLQI